MPLYTFALLMSCSPAKAQKVANLERNLVKALTANHTIIAEFLIQKGADINFEKGKPLKAAVEAQNVKLVQTLLAKDADPDTFIDEDGRTVLMLAASLNNVQLVKALLDYQADWRITVFDDCSNTYKSAEDYTESNEIKALFAEEEQYQREIDNDLIKAIKNGNNVEVKNLIDKWADVDAGYGKERPLYVAIEAKNLEAVTLLLEAKVKTNHNLTDEPSFLHAAVNEEHLKITALLLENGAAINALFEGQTPLFWAVRKENVALVKALIAAGADATIKDPTGKTAVDYAVTDEIHEIVKISFDALQSSRDKAQQERLNAEKAAQQKQEFVDGFIQAIRDGNVALVQSYIDKGANVNHKGALGATPLIEAAVSNQIAIFQLLLNNGAQIDERDDLSHTVNYYASPELKKIIRKAQKNKSKDEL